MAGSTTNTAAVKAAVALERMLLSGNAALVKAQRQLDDTSSLLNCVIDNIRNDMILKETNKQESLYDILSSNGPVIRQVGPSRMIADDSIKNKVFVKGPLWRVHNDCLVIGAVVSNNSHSTLEKIRLGLNLRKPVTFTTMAVPTKGSDQSAKKKRRTETWNGDITTLEPEKGAVLACCLQLKNLQPEMTASVSSYVIYSAQNVEYNHSLPHLEITAAQLLQCSNLLSLNNADISLLDSDEEQMNMVALEAAMLTTNVIIRSVQSSLLDLEQMFKVATGLQRHSVYGLLYWPDGTQYSSLSGSWVRISSALQVQEADVTFHTKDENTLFLLMNHLYDQLPPDVVILPRTKNQKEPFGTARAIGQGIQEEIRTVTTFLQEQNSTLVNNNYQVDVNKYGEFRRKLADNEIRTDSLVCSMV